MASVGEDMEQLQHPYTSLGMQNRTHNIAHWENTLTVYYEVKYALYHMTQPSIPRCFQK